MLLVTTTGKCDIVLKCKSICADFTVNIIDYDYHIIEHLDVHHIRLSQHYDCSCCQYLLKGGEAGDVEEGGNPDAEPEALVKVEEKQEEGRGWRCCR